MSKTTDEYRHLLRQALKDVQKTLSGVAGADREEELRLHHAERQASFAEDLLLALEADRGPGFEVFVNMQKRGDGKVYCDMHKTDGHVYFTREEAQAAIDKDPELAPHRHVVAITCHLSGEED